MKHTALAWREYRPPLAKQLFDPRTLFKPILGKYPACRALVGRLRDVVAQDELSLEGELERVQSEARTHEHLRRQLTAVRFYLRDALWECGLKWFEACAGVLNFGHLLSDLESWRERTDAAVSMVTFNYDLLLEWCCTDVLGWAFPTLDSYVERADWQLFKLHGSVKWGHPLITPQGATIVLSAGNVIDDLGSYEVSSRIVQFKSLADAQAGGCLPAIAIPVEGKSEFECPDLHLEALDAAIDDADTALILGWRGAERHFLERWAAARKTGALHIVSGSTAGAQEVKGRLADFGLGEHATFLSSGGFTDFVRSGELQDALQALDKRSSL